MKSVFRTKTNNQSPKLLDDIICKNRDKVELRLSNSKEIDKLVTKIDGYKKVKDEIENWRLISLIYKDRNNTQILLVGDSQVKNRPGITSPILTIDLEKGIALTQNNSVYRLGNRGLGEPPENDLHCICAAMHSWGNGPALGVPPFSY